MYYLISLYLKCGTNTFFHIQRGSSLLHATSDSNSNEKVVGFAYIKTTIFRGLQLFTWGC